METTGALGRDRTCDLRFRKPSLYPLSYEGNAEQDTALPADGTGRPRSVGQAEHLHLTDTVDEVVLLRE